ncbi:hypothetical protein D3C76_1405070 [compost metagenome]
MALNSTVPMMPIVAASATATSGPLPESIPRAIAGKATKLRSAGIDPPGVTMAIYTA